jgi:predicted CXXCH cytochrome family protein
MDDIGRKNMSLRRILKAACGLGAAVLFLILLPPPAAADHSLGRNCYDCHKLSSTTVWGGTKAIDYSREIGQPAYGNALYCDFCHTGIADEFVGPSGTAANESNHPAYIINGTGYNIYGKDSGDGSYSWQPAGSYSDVKLLCKGCHGGDTVTGSLGPLSPDLAPENYTNTAGNTASDGYPNHDLAAFNGALSAFSPVWDSDVTGDDPHATTGGNSYQHRASTDAADAAVAYELCFSCHDGSGATSHGIDVENAYTVGSGHFFKSDGNRIGCVDCHDSHGSPSLRLYNRGTVTSTVRAVCLDCHGTTKSFTDTTEGTAISGFAVLAAPTSGSGDLGENVAAHGGGSSEPCTSCHDPHNPLGNRDDCYACHASGGSLVTALGGGAIIVNGTSGDSFGYSTPGDDGRHDISFTSGAAGSADCRVCHELTAGLHGDGNTYNDLADPDGDGLNWPVSSASDTEDSFGALVGFCIDCHDGEADTWFSGGLTAPNVNDFIDFGSDGASGGGDDVTNNYGEGDASVTGFTSNSPTMYDTATGAGHDPPGGYQGVPMFAHYSQGNTSGGTAWWQLGSASAPQPFPCLDCHFAHGSANDVLYRSPGGSTAVGAEKYGTDRDMCLDCHDGSTAFENRPAPNPTTLPLDDRFGNTVAPHGSGSSTGCSPSATGGCHNPHAPSCEVCHGYPP